MTAKERKLLMATAQAVIGVLATMDTYPGTPSLVTEVLAGMNAVEFEQIELRMQAARAAREGKQP